MKYLALFAKYLPSVLAGVVAVENVLKGQAPGTTKKQLVVDIVKAGAQAAGQVPEDHVQAIGGMVDLVVGTLNQAGVFTKSTSPTT